MTDPKSTIGGTRRVLHSLLRDVAEPWRDSDIEPVIIGWFQYGWKNPTSQPIGLFRLQYGARTWTTGGYSFGSTGGPTVPSYEAEFEKLAISLREAGWDQLSVGLLPKAGQGMSDEAKPPVEMFLLIENLECHFGVRNKETGHDAYYLVESDGLQPCSDSPKVWFDHRLSHWNPPVFQPSHMPTKPDPDKAAEVSRHIEWWYQTPLMPGDEARERLGGLLTIMFQRLAGLGQSVAIATSPQRFNDAAGDENWLAAFVDGHFWENGVYFTASAETLARSPRSLHEAMGLLQEVLSSDVRKRIAEYLGSAAIEPDTLVLSSDERGYLIAFSSSVDSGGPVYLVDEVTGLPTLIGVAPRLDWQFASVRKVDADGAYVSAPEDHIVQFTALDDWIAQGLDKQQVLNDTPELHHI